MYRKSTPGMVVAIICVVVGFALLGHSTASGADRSVTIIGLRSCATWVEQKRTAALDAVGSSKWVGVALTKHWMIGYISGVNVGLSLNKNLLSNVNADIVEEWADRFCTKNPSKDLSDGMDNLIVELIKLSAKQ